jgi:hypothetical protein
MRRKADRRGTMDLLIPLILVGLWILLSAVVLPRLGVPT